MARICIPYATSEGQTAKIAEVIADVIRGHGGEVEAVDIRDVPDPIPDGYDGVIVGASIHMGHHDKHVRDYVRKHRETLEGVPSAFFSVSLAAHGDEDEAERYDEDFEQQTGWRPTKVTFSGRRNWAIRP